MTRFKTELCNNLIELGSCKYGERCHYAHGAHELRQVTRRHPKYRTERCKNFELTGKCPFGPRCSYVHPKPDLDSLVEQLTRYVHHTKPPKPDSEGEDEEANVTSIFARTTTSASLYSTSESTTSTSSNSNPFLAEVEANKENYPYNPFSEGQAFMGVKKQQAQNFGENTFLLNNQSQRVSSAGPLSSLKNVSNTQAPFQLKDPKVIERPALKKVMQPIEQNNSKSTYQPNSYFEHNTFSQIPTPHPPAQFSSPPITTQANDTFTNDLFGITNPLSDYFTNTTLANNISGETSLYSNKQHYARF